MAEIVSFAIESFRQSMSTHKVKKKKKRGVSVEPSFVNLLPPPSTLLRSRRRYTKTCSRAVFTKNVCQSLGGGLVGINAVRNVLMGVRC